MGWGVVTDGVERWGNFGQFLDQLTIRQIHADDLLGPGVSTLCFML